MTISEEITQNLEKVLSVDAWYGSPVYTIIEQVSFEAAYEKPPGSVHNIAEIVLHMLAWTEDVIDRMNGLSAQTPSSGDWPEARAPDEQKWSRRCGISDLKLVTVNLPGVIQNFPEEKWNGLIIDTRETEPVTTYKELINGFIQHEVYHAGQIALLNRILS